MNISELFFQTILIYLPAVIANMAPVFAHRTGVLLWLNKPLYTRLLGTNKTFRGFVVGIFAGAITGALIFFITNESPYESLRRAIVFGAATGFGALAGDAGKSFIKRRLHIASGVSWIPFDQIDFIFGATLVGLFFMKISFILFIVAIIFGGFLSYVVSSIGFALHIKQSL